MYLSAYEKLKTKNYLKDSRYVSGYKQVTMFLLMIGHNCRNILIQDVFQHCKETVSHYFHNVLQALAAFAKEMIKPPLDGILLDILKTIKYYPWFKDCIRAIDSTHIPTVVPSEKRHKKECTRNVIGCLFVRHTFHVEMVRLGRFCP